MTLPLPHRPRRAPSTASSPTLALAGAFIVTLLALCALLPQNAYAQTTPRAIAIIGTERVGGALARLWARAGHDVLLAAPRPSTHFHLAADIGARTGTLTEAIEFGDVIVLATPYRALARISEEHGAQLAGRIVLDATHPQPHRDGELAVAARASGTAVVSARLLPDARLVRGFSSVPATRLLSEAHREAPRVGIPFATDDALAADTVGQLVRDAGFDAVHVGALAHARAFDPGTPLFGRALSAARIRHTLGQ